MLNITNLALCIGQISLVFKGKIKSQGATGFVPFFEQKIHELFKDFQGHIPHFSRTPFSAKKEP